jgi:hypothetical protein
VSVRASHVNCDNYFFVCDSLDDTGPCNCGADEVNAHIENMERDYWALLQERNAIAAERNEWRETARRGHYTTPVVVVGGFPRALHGEAEPCRCPDCRATPEED